MANHIHQGTVPPTAFKHSGLPPHHRHYPAGPHPFNVEPLPFRSIVSGLFALGLPLVLV